MSAKEASHIDPKSGPTISKVATFGGLEEFKHALRSAEKSLEEIPMTPTLGIKRVRLLIT